MPGKRLPDHLKLLGDDISDLGQERGFDPSSREALENSFIPALNYLCDDSSGKPPDIVDRGSEVQCGHYEIVPQSRIADHVIDRSLDAAKIASMSPYSQPLVSRLAERGCMSLPKNISQSFHFGFFSHV